MYAGVVELVDSTDLGSVTSVVCGFESRRPHHVGASVVSLAPTFLAKVSVTHSCSSFFPANQRCGRNICSLSINTGSHGIYPWLPVFDNMKRQDVPSKQADILLLTYSESDSFRNADTVSDTVIL